MPGTDPKKLNRQLIKNWKFLRINLSGCSVNAKSEKQGPFRHSLFQVFSILNKAMNLCYYGYLGDANMVNQLADSHRAVDADQVQAIAKSIFNDSNASTLYYKSAQETTK